jgi:hypothetical protein
MNLGERVSLRRKSVPVKSGIPPPNDCKSVVYMILKQKYEKVAISTNKVYLTLDYMKIIKIERELTLIIFTWHKNSSSYCTKS